MAVVYSTNDVHPRDSIAYWLDDVIKGFVRYAFTASDGPFRASVRFGKVGDLSIADYKCDPHGAERTARDIARARCDDIVFNLQLSGRSIHCQDDRQAVTEPGGLYLIEPRRPHTGHYQERSRTISIRMPRHTFEARLGSAAPHACRALSSQGPVAGLAFGFLTMITDRMDAIEGSAGAQIVEQALDLLALAISAEGTGRVTLSSPRTVALTLLKAAIEARLHEPELKPTVAAAAAGISVRYANALLAEEDSCLERYIIERRLERCRRVLDDPAQAHRMIGEIAFSWGFSDLSHFNRRFKAEFGRSPGEYRRHVQRASPPPGD
jgi:AraC family transcriptional regulator, positive regulator of tynA and feaB